MLLKETFAAFNSKPLTSTYLDNWGSHPCSEAVHVNIVILKEEHWSLKINISAYERRKFKLLVSYKYNPWQSMEKRSFISAFKRKEKNSILTLQECKSMASGSKSWRRIIPEELGGKFEQIIDQDTIFDEVPHSGVTNITGVVNISEEPKLLTGYWTFNGWIKKRSVNFLQTF